MAVGVGKSARASFRFPPRGFGHAPLASRARGVGNRTADSGGRHPFPGRRPAVPVSDARGVGNSSTSIVSCSRGPPAPRARFWFLSSPLLAEATGVGNSGNSASRAIVSSPGRIAAPGEGDRFVPYGVAVGVGNRCSTSSASVGPCPPAFLLSGCCVPPLIANCAVGVLSSEKPSFPPVRGTKIARS